MPPTRLAWPRGHVRAVLVADEGGLGLPLATNHAAPELVTNVALQLEATEDTVFAGPWPNGADRKGMQHE